MIAQKKIVMSNFIKLIGRKLSEVNKVCFVLASSFVENIFDICDRCNFEVNCLNI